jgi:hypothetical protein
VHSVLADRHQLDVHLRDRRKTRVVGPCLQGEDAYLFDRSDTRHVSSGTFEYERRVTSHVAPALQQLKESPDEAAVSTFFGGSMLDLGEKLLNFLVDLIGLALKHFDRGRLHNQCDQISHWSCL